MSRLCLLLSCLGEVATWGEVFRARVCVCWESRYKHGCAHAHVHTRAGAAGTPVVPLQLWQQLTREEAHLPSIHFMNN